MTHRINARIASDTHRIEIITCETCGGDDLCPLCRGSGCDVRQRQCDVCQGSGVVKCATCDGLGVVESHVWEDDGE